MHHLSSSYLVDEKIFFWLSTLYLVLSAAPYHMHYSVLWFIFPQSMKLQPPSQRPQRTRCVPWAWLWLWWASLLGPFSSSRACAKATLLNTAGLCEAPAGGFAVVRGRHIWNDPEEGNRVRERTCDAFKGKQAQKSWPLIYLCWTKSDIAVIWYSKASQSYVPFHTCAPKTKPPVLELIAST